MSNVQQCPQSGKPEKSNPYPVYQGQTFSCPGLGEGIVFVVNIKMKQGRELGREVIVRYREDPQGHFRTYPMEDFIINNKQIAL